jgi:hypothetical protein
MVTLEQELQTIHDAGIGVSITWLSDGRVDLRLVHRSGVVVAEGNVKEVASVLPWLEGAIKRHFPKAHYGPAANRTTGNSRKLDTRGARENWNASSSGRAAIALMQSP